MDQAIVFTVQQFLGFEICKGLLNKGYEVIAIEHKDMVNDNCVEKWLEIGRNANVTYQLMDKNIESEDHSMTWFVPLYDLFVEKEEKQIKDWINRFQELYNQMKSTIKMIIYINPSQWLSNDDGAENYKTKLDKVINKEETKILEFYVPTIYGPWQPSSFLFQQIISKREKQHYVDDYNDAIYIENAVQAVFQNIDEKLSGEQVLFKSGKIDMWEKCILYLNPSFQLPKRAEERKLNFTKSINVQEMISYTDGLDRQIACYYRNS